MTAVDGDDDVAELTDRLGLRFDDLGLVAQAMSHRSWCAENPGHESYERLEFLGDAVLGWVTADAAFRRFQEMSEGQLTGIRKGVVNTVALAELAVELGIGPYIKLGKGEAAAGGSSKPSILADAMEALIGAIYLDRGSATAYDFVASLIADRVELTAERLDELDFKTTLQELLAGAGMAPPRVRHLRAGPRSPEALLRHGVGQRHRARRGGGAFQAVGRAERSRRRHPDTRHRAGRCDHGPGRSPVLVTMPPVSGCARANASEGGGRRSATCVAGETRDGHGACRRPATGASE